MLPDYERGEKCKKIMCVYQCPCWSYVGQKQPCKHKHTLNLALNHKMIFFFFPLEWNSKDKPTFSLSVYKLLAFQERLLLTCHLKITLPAQKHEIYCKTFFIASSVHGLVNVVNQLKNTKLSTQKQKCDFLRFFFFFNLGTHFKKTGHCKS